MELALDPAASHQDEQLRRAGQAAGGLSSCAARSVPLCSQQSGAGTRRFVWHVLNCFLMVTTVTELKATPTLPRGEEEVNKPKRWTVNVLIRMEKRDLTSRMTSISIQQTGYTVAHG